MTGQVVQFSRKGKNQGKNPGARIQNSEVRNPAHCAGTIILDSGFWILASGFWLLDSGFWILASGFWLLDSGSWLLAPGF
jgi:hypothetical protein